MLLGKELREEQYLLAQQNFFEEHFEYGSDQETVRGNYEKSVELFLERYMRTDELVTAVCYGEAVDNATLLQTLQEMLFSRDFAIRFREELFGTGELLHPESVELDADNVKNAMRGNANLGAFATSHNPLDYETGKWLLLNAVGQ